MYNVLLYVLRQTTQTAASVIPLDYVRKIQIPTDCLLLRCTYHAPFYVCKYAQSTEKQSYLVQSSDFVF